MFKKIFNNKRIRVVLISLAVALIVFLSLTVAIVAAETTGNTLVLVSKDYLDSVIFPKIESQAATLSDLDEKYQLLQNSYTALLEKYDQLAAQGSGGSVTATTSGYTRIKLEAGKTVYPAGENQVCIEVILEKGTAVVVTTIETETVLDASSGEGLNNGTEITEGHYLIVPCANIGTGISAPNADAWILIRGEYTVE